MKKAFALLAAIAASALLVTLTAIGAKSLDGILTERMAELKTVTMAALESMAGRRITYSSISPSILQYLEARDLTIYDSHDSQKALLTIRRVRIYYSLARLLAGRDALAALREVRLLNSRLSLDLDRDRDVVELFVQLAGEGGGGPTPLHARITGANIAISVASGGSRVSLENCYFQMDAKERTIAVALRGSCSAELPGGFSFASVLRMQGSLDRSLTASDMTVRLLSFKSSLINTGAQTLHVAWNGDTVTFKKIQDRLPVQLELMVDGAKRELTLNFQSEDARLDRLLTLSRSLAKYQKWLKAPLTASGHVTYRLDGGTLDYQVDASTVLEEQLPLRQVTVDSSFRGSEKETFFQPLRLSFAAGTVEFEGSLLLSSLTPEGLLTLASIDPGTGEKVDATFSVVRRPDGFAMEAGRFLVGQLAFDQFTLAVSPTESGALFSVSASFDGPREQDLVMASGELRFRQPVGKTVAEGVASGIDAPTIMLTGALKNAAPEQLYHLLMGARELSREQLDLYNILARFSVSAEIDLSTDFSSLTVNSRTVTVTEPEDPATHLSFGLVADSAHVALSDFAGTWKGLTVKGGFKGVFAQGGQMAFSSDFAFLGTPYSFTGRFTPKLGLVATGSYGLEISAIPQRGGALSFRLKGDRFPLPLPERPLPVSFTLDGLVSPEGDWSVDFSAVTLSDLPFLESKKNTLQLTGRLTPKRLEVTRLTFADGVSTLTGTAGADIALPTDVLGPRFMEQLSARGSATVRSAGGAETYSAQGELANGTLTLGVQFAGSPLPRIMKSVVSGSLAGTGTVSGPLSRPGADLALVLKEGKLGSDTLSLGGQVTVGAESIQARGLTVNYLSHRITGGAGSIDLKSSLFSFSGRYQGDFFGDQVRLAAAVDGQFPPNRSSAGLAGLFDAGLQGKLALTDIAVASTGFPSWNVAFRGNQGKLSFDGGPGNALHGSIDSKLAFALTLADPFPISGSAAGSIAGVRISATADVESLDLVVLNSILKSSPVPTSAGPFPVYKITAGVATGRLAIEGPINDPDFTGQLDVVGGGLVSAYSPDEAGPIRASFTFDGKTFHSPRIYAAAGPARLSAEATFTIDHWAPRSYDIVLATEGTAPARLRARFGRLVANGSATGLVRIVGDDRRTNVSGDLRVTDCRITLGDAPTGKFVPEETPTFVALTAETGKRVEFYWPSENLPVIRATASPGGRIAISYRGDTGAYTVKGTTGVQGGEIYYFDRSFIMRKGSIAFNEDQSTFDPWITATAEVREWDPNTGEEVKIHLDADSPLSKFSPRFTSDPPRADAAILAMIGAPLVTRAESQGLGMAALIYSDILSQTWVLRPFEQKVRQLLNLDLFSIRTQLLQNLVAQKLFGVTVNPLDNTSVSLGKYLGNDLFLEMFVRLQQQRLPSGLSSAPGSLAAATAGLKPDLELSLEWATPFFLLNWSFLPRHPESLFLTDNSLAFSWKLSY